MSLPKLEEPIIRWTACKLNSRKILQSHSENFNNKIEQSWQMTTHFKEKCDLLSDILKGESNNHIAERLHGFHMHHYTLDKDK